MESTEALWVGDDIRVRADGVLEDWAGESVGWVRYAANVSPSDAQAIAHAFAAVAKQLESFRQALPESERGPGWEQAVLTAIDTRREVLAAVDAHVQGWHPGRSPAEVVAHLTDEIALLRDAERGAQAVAAEALAAQRKAEAERDDLAGRLATEEGERIRCRDGWAEAVRINDAALAECDDLKARLAAAEEKVETYRKQGESDWNACCDVLTWARRFAKDLPPPSRAVTAVCERVKELDPMFSGPNGETAVAPSPEFAAARLAESVMRMRFVALAEGEERVARLREKAATNTSDSNYWAGRVQQANVLKNMARALAVGTTEHVSPAYEFAPSEADPYVSRVTEFHRAMGLPVRTVPSVGTVEERVLRVRLLLDEVLEYAKASAVRVLVHVGHGGVLHGVSDLEFEPHDADEPDLAAMTHELGDCQVIVSGCAVQLGLPLLAAVAEEIHPANMRKLGPDGRPVVRADGKVVKPDGWQPANVARIVERALAVGEVSRG